MKSLLMLGILGYLYIVAPIELRGIAGFCLLMMLIYLIVL